MTCYTPINNSLHTSYRVTIEVFRIPSPTLPDECEREELLETFEFECEHLHNIIPTINRSYIPGFTLGQYMSGRIVHKGEVRVGDLETYAIKVEEITNSLGYLGHEWRE